MASRTVRCVVFFAGLLGVLLGSAGCTGQRPLHIVRSDAEFAAQFGNYDKAKADFGEYIKRRPEASDVRYELAKAQIDSGDPKAAIEQLTVALDVEPLNDKYLDAQAEAMFKAGERDALTALLMRNASERGRVSDYLRLGTYSAKLGNADEAQTAFKTAVERDHNQHVGPQRALADFYGSVGDRAKQVTCLRIAYGLEPANAETLKEIRRLGEIPGPSFALTPEN